MLLEVKDLTLDTAITKCRGLETAKKSRQDIEGTPEINAVPIQHAKNKAGTCSGCGGNHHEGGRQNCPAYHQSCHNCGKVGHFSRVCRARQKPLVYGSRQKTDTPQANTLSIMPLIQVSNISTHDPEARPRTAFYSS